MNINIKNYKNLSNLSLDIDDGKLNLVLGISGCGKTSIAEALISDDISKEENKTLGQNSSPIVLLNGTKVPAGDVILADCHDGTALFENLGDEKDYYSVLIDDDKDVQMAYLALDQSMSVFKTNKPSWDKQVDAFRTLIDSLRVKIKKNGEISDSSILMKCKNVFGQSKDGKRVIADIKKTSFKYVSWVRDGREWIDSNGMFCPYCKKKLNKSLVDRANIYDRVDVTKGKDIGSVDTGLNPLSMGLDDLFSKGDRVLARIKSAYRAVEQYDELIDLFESFKSNRKYDVPCFKSLSKDRKDLYSFLPDVKAFVDAFKKNFSNQISAVKKAKKQTAECLKRNLKPINDEIKKFGIPYHLNFNLSDGRVNDLILCHDRGGERGGDERRLSNGEKTIISLLLWVWRVRKMNGKLIIFDDPISNYNDGKRQTFLRLIEKRLKGKTILLLSYDQSFAKIFIALRPRSKAFGSVLYLENDGNAQKVLPIDANSFVRFDEALRDKRLTLINGQYLEKLLFLRVFYEKRSGKLGENGNIDRREAYSYLSGVLHSIRTGFNEAMTAWSNFFQGKSYDEAMLLEEIKNDSMIQLDKYDYNLLMSSDVSCLKTTFEKAVLAREFIPTSGAKYEELSNYVHLCNALVVCLDPYKYSLCSNYVLGLLQKVNGLVKDIEIS